MKLRLTILALLLALLGATSVVPMQARAATHPATPITAAAMSNGNGTTPINTLTAVPVTGTYGMGQGKKSGMFSGLLYVQSFADQGGKLVALGKISGVMTNPGGKVFKTVTNAPVTLPIQKVTSSGAGSSSSGAAMAPEARGVETRVAAVGCQILNLNLGPLSLNLLGLQVNLSQVVLNITAIPGAGNLLGNLLCGVANLLNGGLALNNLATLLNSILQILRPTGINSPFANIPLLGSATGGLAARGVTGAAALQSLGERATKAAGANNFVGLFTIKEFVKNTAGDGLLAKGTVTGLFGNGKSGTQDVSIPVTPTAGTSSSATPTPGTGAIAPDAVAAAPMTSTAGCQILNLNLAPTSLNLLGLQVNLSQVVLNITAIPGAGNLLGNLLCAVTNLLNGLGIAPAARANVAPSAAIERRARRASSVDYGKLATSLTNLLNAYKGTISQPFAAVPVTGTARGKGTFTGLLDIQRFTTQNGKVMAAGVLSGVLSGAGNKAGVVQQSVMVPVSSGAAGSGAGTGAITPQGLPKVQVAASCSILNLVLGPLSLNLLGLQVNLNRVVLTITGQQGAGNLLGNLLCGLTNLLNGLGTGGALSGLQNLLSGLQALLNLFA